MRRVLYLHSSAGRYGADRQLALMAERVPGEKLVWLPMDGPLVADLRAAGAEVETAVYDGAPHSFFDRAADQWAEASADAWRRLLALLDRVAG